MQSCASDNYCNENTFWRLVKIWSSWTGFGQYEKKNYANKKCWSNFQNFEIKIKPRRLGWLTSREIFKGHVDSRWVQGEGELKWMNLGIIPSINTSTKSGAPGFNNRHEMLKNNSAVYFRLSKVASYTSGRTGHRVIYYNWHQTICGVSLREPSVKNVFRKGFFNSPGQLEIQDLLVYLLVMVLLCHKKYWGHVQQTCCLKTHFSNLSCSGL